MHKTSKIVGTLLPLTALPETGFTAGMEFLEWLHKTKQNAWQLLPLHETQLEQGSRSRHVPSPYKSYGIGLDPRYQSAPGSASKNDSKSLELFIEQHKDWVYDYALFCALRDEFRTDDWRSWETGLRTRDTATLTVWKKKLKSEIKHYITLQWQLHTEYAALRVKAHSLGILLFGDLPYYPSFRSPLVWAHQDVFQINDDGSLPYVSGIPLTPGTHFGRQIWGHPLYNWEYQKDKVIALWELRLRYLSSIFHTIRFDHAKAFFAYGAMDIKNQKNDSYRKGPGADVMIGLISYAERQGLTIFAEDSGDNIQELRTILNKIAIAGMRIYRFAIKRNELHDRYARISEYPEKCVAYTTTHDTETLLGFLHTLSDKQKKLLAQCSGMSYISDEQFAQEIRNAIISSPANTVILPIQDWLLTTDRINIPGTEKEVGDTNWQFKLITPISKLPTELVTISSTRQKVS